MLTFSLRAAALAVALLPAFAVAAPLTLTQALDLAVQRSEFTRSARAGVTSASEAARAAGQLPDPTLRAGVDNLPVTGGDRLAAARYGLSVADVQAVVTTAIGGDNVGEVIQGRERYPVNVRYPREVRDSLEKLRQLPFVSEKGATVLLQDVARVSIEDGPPMLRSENARLSGWVYVDVRGRDLRSVVTDMQAAVAKQVSMPAGYAVSWSGQFEYLERATERLKLVVPVTPAVARSGCQVRSLMRGAVRVGIRDAGQRGFCVQMRNIQSFESQPPDPPNRLVQRMLIGQ
jgi:multidrug efflux pump subunit AcrB